MTMLIIAYLSNQFPSAVEPYVTDEIQELEGRGAHIIPSSARRPLKPPLCFPDFAARTLYLQPLKPKVALRALYLCFAEFPLLASLYGRVLFHGRESPLRRAKALVHTWLGVYYALLLKDRGVEHIHVHHGYFASWIAMVAARVLGIGFSMTLHGSDLLVHRAYLDTKLENCRFCLTISSFNRWHLLKHYPAVSPGKVLIRRMGVELLRFSSPRSIIERDGKCMVLLSVGRLHPVKDHAFLVHACRKLKDRGFTMLCLIVGEGRERVALEHLIDQLDLKQEVELVGELPRDWISYYYQLADLVLLTSRSEGIPLVLMEAMALERTVLAPAITGIPELVEHGKTGFLYRAGSLEDLVMQIETIWNMRSTHAPLRKAARDHVQAYYNRKKNLGAFADSFLARVRLNRDSSYENSLLQ